MGLIQPPFLLLCGRPIMETSLLHPAGWQVGAGKQQTQGIPADQNLIFSSAAAVHNHNSKYSYKRHFCACCDLISPHS